MTHALHLYQEESCLLEALVDYVAEGLRLDEGIVIIGSTQRGHLLPQQLQGSGVDARNHALRGQLRLLGQQIVLSTCLADGMPVRHKFGQVMGAVLGLARMRYTRVRGVSDLTDSLGRGGQRESACALERAWRPL